VSPTISLHHHAYTDRAQPTAATPYRVNTPMHIVAKETKMANAHDNDPSHHSGVNHTRRQHRNESQRETQNVG
jgi:hypothetical protein